MISTHRQCACCTTTRRKKFEAPVTFTLWVISHCEASPVLRLACRDSSIGKSTARARSGPTPHLRGDRHGGCTSHDKGRNRGRAHRLRGGGPLLQRVRS